MNAGTEGHHIRPATPREVEAMQAIEVDAGQRFRDIGLVEVADDPPPSQADLLRHIADATAWVAVSSDKFIIGYATASVVDHEGHLDQVSVAADAGGRGVGGALVDRVVAWADALALPAVSLTTYRDVAWNGPWYRRLGFVPVAEVDLGPELAAIRQAERDAGLDVRPRLAMRRISR